MKFYFRAGLLFIICLICSNLYPALGQQKIFSPSVQNDALLKSVSTSLEQRYQKDIAGLPSENKKDLLKVYKQRWDNVQDKFDKKEIYTNASAQKYLDEITSEIVKANPLL